MLVLRQDHGMRAIVLCGEGLVVHEEEVDVTGVVDEEGLVAGGHHVAGLLVGTVANLYVSSEFVLVLAAARCRADRVRCRSALRACRTALQVQRRARDFRTDFLRVLRTRADPR